MLACAALVVCSCQETDPKPELSFESGTYVMGADEALTVKVVTNMAPAADLTVDFTVSGTAVKDSDYELSAESFTIKAGETVGEITVTPKNNVASDLNISLTLTLPAGYEAGNHLNTIIALGAKETISYSFAQASVELTGETIVTLNLIGGTTGADFVATGEYRLPFTLEGTAVLGTNFEVVDNATEFVVAKGAKSASITLKAKAFEDGKSSIVIGIDASAYGDMFEAGVNRTATVTIVKPFGFDDLVGKWAYASAPLIDDPDAALWLFDMMLSDLGLNTIADYPTGTQSDIIEFKNVEGVHTLTPTGSGTVLNYFRECEVSGFVPGKYTWYFYGDGIGEEFDIYDINLSKVNYDYSATLNTEQAGSIKIRLTDDGNTLHVFITDYAFTDLFAETYEVMESSWDEFDLYFDLYFTFTRVTE